MGKLVGMSGAGARAHTRVKGVLFVFPLAVVILGSQPIGFRFAIPSRKKRTRKTRNGVLILIQQRLVFVCVFLKESAYIPRSAIHEVKWRRIRRQAECVCGSE